jgi:hypothetical protein
MIGIAVAGLTTIMLLPDKRNGKRNGVLEKINKVKASLKKDRNGRTGKYEDIPDCFI